jgi:purine-binding chemotaxis protein CheW
VRGSRSWALVVRAGSRWAALPLSTVGETMRPLPVEALPGTPAFVSGVSMVRGEPVPVVDLEALIGGARGGDAGHDGGHPQTPTRFVTARSEAGTFMLAVSEVLGVREIPADALRELPLLLGAEAASLAVGVAAHDGRLVTLLLTARLVPADVWQALRAHGGAH